MIKSKHIIMMFFFTCSGGQASLDVVFITLTGGDVGTATTVQVNYFQELRFTKIRDQLLNLEWIGILHLSLQDLILIRQRPRSC